MTNTTRRMFLDIETACREEALALMPDPKAPGNIKDPEKIRIAVEEKRRELIETAALDPDYGKILSVGHSLGIDEPVKVLMVGDVVQEPFWNTEKYEGDWRDYILTEADVVELFWMHFGKCHGNCVGYNILSFDLPYLLRRSMYLGIRVPVLPVLARYRMDPVTDLMMILCNWDTYKAKSLKTMAKLLGIPNDCPDVGGSKVKDLTPDQLRAYQASDVKLTIELYKRMNGVYFSHY